MQKWRKKFNVSEVDQKRPRSKKKRGDDDEEETKP